MTADRPRLGDVFRGTGGDSALAAPLAGLLPTPPPRLVTVPTPSEETSPTEKPTRRTATKPRVERSAAEPAEPDALRLVPVSVDASVHREMKDFASRTEQTYATLAVRAIEAQADDLARHWAARSEPRPAGRIFASSTQSRLRRRAEPGVQVLLRMRAGDAATLDSLVEEWQAPSRSALVTEALRRHLTVTSGDSS